MAMDYESTGVTEKAFYEARWEGMNFAQEDGKKLLQERLFR